MSHAFGQRVRRTWALRLQRAALSSLSSCYACARLGDGGLAHGQAFLQATADRCFVAALCLWHRARVGDEFVCTDSSDAGFGVLERDVPADVMAAWGRQIEQFRFILEDLVDARDHALGLDADRLKDHATYHDAAFARSDDTHFFTDLQRLTTRTYTQ